VAPNINCNDSTTITAIYLGVYFLSGHSVTMPWAVVFVCNTAVSTLSPSTIPPPPCASDERRATLNYEDTVQGTSEFLFFVLLPDHSTLHTDVTTALRGSNTWLTLPSSEWEDEPVRLIIRRSLDAPSPQLRIASLKLNVLYAHHVVVEFFNTERQLAAQHAVR